MNTTASRSSSSAPTPSARSRHGGWGANRLAHIPPRHVYKGRYENTESSLSDITSLSARIEVGALHEATTAQPSDDDAYARKDDEAAAVDAGVAAIVGAGVGALATIAGTEVESRRQKRARVDQLVAEVAGVENRYKTDWREPRADFYARCIEIERIGRSDRQRRAARSLRAADTGTSAQQLEQFLEDLVAR